MSASLVELVRLFLIFLILRTLTHLVVADPRLCYALIELVRALHG